MNHLYCGQCGTKNLYEINPPNFCSKCGSSLNESRANNIAEPIRVNNQIDDPDGEDIFKVPSISRLEYTIEGDEESQPIKFGDIVKQEQQNAKEGAPPPQKSKRRPVRERPRKKGEAKSGTIDPIKQSIQDCASNNKINDVEE